MRWIIIVILAICSVWSCKEDGSTKKSAETVFSGDTDLDFVNKQLDQNNLDAGLRYVRAQLLFDRKQYDAAIEDLRVAIMIDSMKPEYYHLLSDAFMDNALSSKSLQTMKVAANLFPERIPTLLKLSETHYIIKQYEESLGILNEVTRLDPQNAEAYLMIGLNFRAIGDDKKAVNALQTATEFDSKLIDAWVILSEIFEKKDLEKAIQYLRTALRISPEDVFAKHSLAYLLQNNNKINEAIELYREITITDKNYTDANLNLGILYLEQDSLIQAKEQFNILVNQTPLDPRSHYYLGLTKYMMDNYEGAKIDVQNALNLNPDYEKAQVLLSKINE